MEKNARRNFWCLIDYALNIISKVNNRKGILMDMGLSYEKRDSASMHSQTTKEIQNNFFTLYKLSFHATALKPLQEHIFQTYTAL